MQCRQRAAPTRDLVGSLARGLAVMEILARHPAGLTLTETAATGRADPRGRAAFPAHAGGRRLCAAGRAALPADGAAPVAGARNGFRALRCGPLQSRSCASWPRGSTNPARPRCSPTRTWSMSRACRASASFRWRCTSARACPPIARPWAGCCCRAFPTPRWRCSWPGRKSPARTRKTVTDRVRLAELVRAVRRDGYALVDEELEIGLRSIAVPIRDRTGRVVAAINVPAQSARQSVAQMKRTLLPSLMEAARKIEDFLVVQ